MQLFINSTDQFQLKVSIALEIAIHIDNNNNEYILKSLSVDFIITNYALILTIHSN